MVNNGKLVYGIYMLEIETRTSAISGYGLPGPDHYSAETMKKHSQKHIITTEQKHLEAPRFSCFQKTNNIPALLV